MHGDGWGEREIQTWRFRELRKHTANGSNEEEMWHLIPNCRYWIFSIGNFHHPHSQACGQDEGCVRGEKDGMAMFRHSQAWAGMGRHEGIVPMLST